MTKFLNPAESRGYVSRLTLTLTNQMLHSMVFMLLLVATVLWPRLSPAMEIQMFDDMAQQDQRDYLKYLVKAVQQVLIDQGRGDLVPQVDKLFRQPRGEREFQENLKFNRDYLAAHPDLPFPLRVEAALLQTLHKNGIPMSRDFQESLGQVTREKPFWPKRPVNATNQVGVRKP